MTEELTGRRIVVPETRELGRLLRMLEERGADTVPCPMIAIRDAPDPVPINAWLRRFAKGTCNDLVLMTGEGLRRLLGFARRLDLEPAFRVALAETRKITRGPKPVRALREIGLAPTSPPTNPRLKALLRHWNGMTSRGVALACSYIPAMRMSDFCSSSRVPARKQIPCFHMSTLLKPTMRA
jgi:uroporphyrinogen-III synthase